MHSSASADKVKGTVNSIYLDFQKIKFYMFRAFLFFITGMSEGVSNDLFKMCGSSHVDFSTKCLTLQPSR